MQNILDGVTVCQKIKYRMHRNSLASNRGFAIEFIRFNRNSVFEFGHK